MLAPLSSYFLLLFTAFHLQMYEANHKKNKTYSASLECFHVYLYMNAYCSCKPSTMCLIMLLCCKFLTCSILNYISTTRKYCFL